MAEGGCAMRASIPSIPPSLPSLHTFHIEKKEEKDRREGHGPEMLLPVEIYSL
jgi:hypothetical protein